MSRVLKRDLAAWIAGRATSSKIIAKRCRYLGGRKYLSASRRLHVRGRWVWLHDPRLRGENLFFAEMHRVLNGFATLAGGEP